MSFSFFAEECDWWGKENLHGELITDLGKTRYICTPLGKAHDVGNRLWSRVATENLPHTVYHHFELQSKVDKENLRACISRWKSSFWQF